LAVYTVKIVNYCISHVNNYITFSNATNGLVLYLTALSDKIQNFTLSLFTVFTIALYKKSFFMQVYNIKTEIIL